MAMLYPWATKEYLLWEMTLGQVVTYHNVGIEIKHGTGADPNKPRSIANMSQKDRAKLIEDARRINEQARQQNTRKKDG